MAVSIGVAGPQQVAVSRRIYNALTYGLIALAFVITGLMYSAASGGALQAWITRSPILALVFFLAGVIGGFILMGIGKSKESVALSIAGFAIFAPTFGGSLALILTRYNIGTITTAFAITACLSGIFMIAGIIFPEFFAKLGRILALALISLIVIELVSAFFLHINQTILDVVGIAIFCGYLGYDSYHMAQDEPTVSNAIFYAANMYIDIANILIRILDILDNK